MTHPPSPEAKWTQAPTYDSVIYAGDQMLGCLVGDGNAARAVACHNACQSIPGDPEMALASCRLAMQEAVALAEVWWPGTAALQALRNGLKSLGYDGGAE